MTRSRPAPGWRQPGRTARPAPPRRARHRWEARRVPRGRRRNPPRPDPERAVPDPALAAVLPRHRDPPASRPVNPGATSTAVTRCELPAAALQWGHSRPAGDTSAPGSRIACHPPPATPNVTDLADLARNDAPAPAEAENRCSESATTTRESRIPAARGQNVQIA
jgi:hypothetical protein